MKRIAAFSIVLAAVFCTGWAGGQNTSCVPPAGLTANPAVATAAVAWNAVPAAVSYTVRYRPVPSPSGAWQSVTVQVTSAALTGLACNTSYEWQVQSLCGFSGNAAVTSGFGPSAFFTTLSCPTPTPCNAPTNPSTGAVTPYSAVVSWAASASAYYYMVRYRPFPAPSVVSWQYQVVSTTSALLTNLQCATGYEWQVRSICANNTVSNVAGFSAFTASTVFTTSACQPGCPTPGNLASSGVSASGATATWSPVATALSYIVRYRPVNSPVATPWMSVATPTNSATLANLLCNTQYEWQVRSVCTSSSNIASLSPFSPPAYFTTAACSGGGCATPTGLSAGPSSSVNGMLLSWNATGAQAYNIRYRHANTLAWTNTTSTTNSIVLTGLAGQSLYEWQVQGVCSSNTGTTTLSAWSASAYFTTPSPMPLTPVVEASRIVVFQEAAVRQAVQLVLRNMMGQAVRSENLDIVMGLNQYTINTDGLANGLYVLEVTGEGTRETAKVYVHN